MNAGPLDGIRVVDLTHHLGGPLATMALGQLGADVVKVEPPGGDQWRLVDDVQGESRVFHAVNRDKRGVVIDLRTADGLASLLDLVDAADVFVHSFSPGVVEKLGVGPATLRARNPGLVYCALSAFGPFGRRGTDVALQAESGVVAANGGRVLPVPAHDTIAPWIMVSGVLAALFARQRTGEGQVVETSLLEASAALAAHRLIRDGSGEPLFNRFVGALYRTYDTADGSVAIACYAPRLHAPLLRALGLEWVLDDPRFAELPDRARHSDELAAIIAERLAADPTEDVLALLRASGLPHGSVSATPFALLDHPDAQGIGLVVEVDDPTLGTELVTGPPLRMSGTPLRTSRPAPRLGQHTDEVLGRAAGPQEVTG